MATEVPFGMEKFVVFNFTSFVQIRFKITTGGYFLKVSEIN